MGSSLDLSPALGLGVVLGEGSSVRAAGDVELALASRWPEEEHELGGEEEERLLLGAKGYGREGARPEGLLSRRSGMACGAHTWWGAFGLGLWVGPEFSILYENILRMSPRHTANISFFL
jgi:hypothetical protein